MRITHAFERTVAVPAPFRNATIDLSGMTATLVAVVSDQRRGGRPLAGYAFSSFGRYGCGGPLRDRFFARLLEADPASYRDAEHGHVDPALASRVLMRNEKRGGHAERSMSLGTLELALWDLAAKARELPLCHLLAERYGTGEVPQRLPVYVGGGFYGGDDPAHAGLQDELRRYRDAGYRRMKIKAGGLPLHDDLRRIEAALRVVGRGENLALDLSCAFAGDAATAFAAAVAPLDLWWIEEPCGPLDFETYRQLSMAYPGLVAGGENLFSREEVLNFLRYGPRPERTVLQPDPPLCYGIDEYARIVRDALALGVARQHILPHGGNLMSLHVAAGLGLGSAESYPGLFGPFGGFGDTVRIEDGTVSVPAVPGIGFETQGPLFDLLRDLTRELA